MISVQETDITREMCLGEHGLQGNIYHCNTLWSQAFFSPWLRDKIWEWPGDEASSEDCQLLGMIWAHTAKKFLVKMTMHVCGNCSFRVHWTGWYSMHGYRNSQTQLSSINPLTISSSFKKLTQIFVSKPIYISSYRQLSSSEPDNDQWWWTISCTYWLADKCLC